MPRLKRRKLNDGESDLDQSNSDDDSDDEPVPPPPTGNATRQEQMHREYKKGTRWPLIHQTEAWDAALDFDGDATDSDDDYDENGQYAREKSGDQAPTYDTADPDDPTSGIAIPYYIPGTPIPFPDDPVVRHNYRKVVFALYYHGCEETWVEPKTARCKECGEWLDWAQGDYVQPPFVKGKRLTILMDFRGAAKCRYHATQKRKEWAASLTNEERLAMLRAYRSDGLKHLFVMSTQLLSTNEKQEKECGVPRHKQLRPVLAKRRDDSPKFAVAAFLLSLGQTNGEGSGAGLATSSLNFQDKKLVSSRLDDLLELRCPYSGRKLSLTTADRDVGHLSFDRGFSNKPYFNAKQEIEVMSWGWNALLSNFDNTTRCKLVDLVQERDEELADASLKVQEAAGDPNLTDAEFKEVKRAARAVGWRQAHGEADWNGENGKNTKHAYQDQKRRGWVEGRPGRDWTSVSGERYLDRRGWQGSDDVEKLEEAKAFHINAGDVCAVTGARSDADLGLHMECDRITDDSLYTWDDCLILLGPVNRFKSTLPCFRTRAALLAHIASHPRINEIYLACGLKKAAVAIIRIELDGGFY